MERSGIISRVYGAYYDILELPDLSRTRRGRLRGRLRLEKGRPENARERHLLIVGDRVNFLEDPGAEDVAIEALLPRRNAIRRGGAYEDHALGANIDQAAAVISLAQPGPRWGFLDRFLASCYAGDAPAWIVFTKADLAPAEPNAAEIFEMIALYRALGYRTFLLDLLLGQPADELAELRRLIARGVTLLAGPSGAGKSSLLNLLLGRTLQRTGEISASTGKGRHTTTNSSLYYESDSSALLIDTPGVKEWGLHHLDRRTILESFPELHAVSGECRYADCDHAPGARDCAVQALLRRSRERALAAYADEDAVDKADDTDAGLIHPDRYRSLAALLESLEYTDRIRTGDYIKPTGRVRTGRLRSPDE
jgi:ribosome biogenesis GTPase / thiamine phosphate phosphatase